VKYKDAVVRMRFRDECLHVLLTRGDAAVVREFALTETLAEFAIGLEEMYQACQ
jgi:hypothetical protein